VRETVRRDAAAKRDGEGDGEERRSERDGVERRSERDGEERRSERDGEERRSERDGAERRSERDGAELHVCVTHSTQPRRAQCSTHRLHIALRLAQPLVLQPHVHAAPGGVPHARVSWSGPSSGSGGGRGRWMRHLSSAAVRLKLRKPLWVLLAAASSRSSFLAIRSSSAYEPPTHSRPLSFLHTAGRPTAGWATSITCQLAFQMKSVLSSVLESSVIFFLPWSAGPPPHPHRW
jgi:hypothetical protein